MNSTTPHFRTFAPSPPLADIVERYWINEGSAPAHAFDLVLPGGREELLVNLIDGELRCYHEDGRPHGRTAGPGPHDAVRARSEGWIHVPVSVPPSVGPCRPDVSDSPRSAAANLR